MQQRQHVAGGDHLLHQLSVIRRGLLHGGVAVLELGQRRGNSLVQRLGIDAGTIIRKASRPVRLRQRITRPVERVERLHAVLASPDRLRDTRIARIFRQPRRCLRDQLARHAALAQLRDLEHFGQQRLTHRRRPRGTVRERGQAGFQQLRFDAEFQLAQHRHRTAAPFQRAGYIAVAHLHRGL
ncbi:MAG TPA: hypothetical protein VGI78_29440 [Acetobacteraceae bacterium]